jgi:hypothetical protein
MADDPVAHVQGFCNVLGQANADLSAAHANLVSYAEHVQQTQSAADERFNLLSETLHSLVTEATSATEGVTGDVDELGSAAHDTAAGRLTAAAQGIDGSEDRLSQALHDGSQALQGAHDDLVRDGFDASRTTLTAVNTDLDASQAATAQAFDDLAHTLEAKAKELDAAGDAAEQAFAAASADVDQVEQAIGQSLSNAAESWNNTLLSETNDAGTNMAGTIEAAYKQFEGTAGQSGQTLVAEVSQAAKDATDHLSNELDSQIQSLYDQTTAPALDALEAALRETQQALGTGEEACNKLEPMIRDLEMTKSKAAELESVLQAMD